MRTERTLRAVLTAALLLGVTGLLGLQGAETARSAGKRLGFAPVQDADGVLVASVTPGRPAHRGGLRAGDRILAVNGSPIAHLAAYEEEAQGFRRGHPAALRVRRGGEVRDLALVPGVPPRWGLFLLNSLTVLGYLAVALLAILQSAGDLRARLLVGFTAAVALEIALPIDAVGRPWLGAAASSAYYLLTGLQMGVELHLASLTPKHPAWLDRRPWIVPLYYLAGLGVGTVSCAAYLGESLFGVQALPWSSLQVDTLLREAVLPAWSLAVTVLLAAQALRHPEPRGRHQAGLVLAGTLPWLLFVVANTVPQRMGYAVPGWVGLLEPLVLLCYPVAFFLAIFRYHLFDIELVVRRGLVYTTLTGALMVVFYAALGAGSALTSLLVGDRESVWTVSAATLLLGLVFAPLRRALHRIIDRHFFPERYAMRRRLVALAGELPAKANLPRKGRHLVARLSAIFLERSANLLADPEGLTGLLRREGILEQLDRELERALRYGRPLAVAMADIDHFKQVNDRHGHLAGDTLLKRVSQALAEGLRGTDWIGRYGGEEFLLVLPETDMAGAAGVAEKLRSRVQGLVVPLEDGSPVRVTISIGLAAIEAKPRDGGASARDLIAAADRSLYEAKNGGRNRVCARVA